MRVPIKVFLITTGINWYGTQTQQMMVYTLVI
jgi:hypothetical protein